ncbi:MAG: 6,7-dimethyl-8-ribityllumazine synthase [Gemmatimonadales bacterium]
MADIQGALTPTGRIAIVVSRYHERITSRLLTGALECCRQAGVADDARDVLWVPGAFELGVVVEEVAASGRYAAVVALGVVVRGETPHFDYVAGETSSSLAATARVRRVPVGFGLLTVDTTDQALARAGGAQGNKGFEAAEAAIRTASVLASLRASDAES